VINCAKKKTIKNSN